MVDTSSGNGNTTRELGVNKIECVGRGILLSKVVEAAIGRGEVVDALELTVYDVMDEVWKAAGKFVEDISLERTEGLAVLWGTSEVSTVLENEYDE